MDDTKLKAAALAFAEEKRSSPPLAYAERDGMLVVVLSDGRKFTVPFESMLSTKAESKQVKPGRQPTATGNTGDMSRQHPPALKKAGRIN